MNSAHHNVVVLDVDTDVLLLSASVLVLLLILNLVVLVSIVLLGALVVPVHQQFLAARDLLPLVRLLVESLVVHVVGSLDRLVLRKGLFRAIDRVLLRDLRRGGHIGRASWSIAIDWHSVLHGQSSSVSLVVALQVLFDLSGLVGEALPLLGLFKRR